MKTGINSKKLNVWRKILTPVLILALVLMGLWLPEVKVKAWTPGNQVTIHFYFDLQEGNVDPDDYDDFELTSSEFYQIDSNGGIAYKFVLPAYEYKTLPVLRDSGCFAIAYNIVDNYVYYDDSHLSTTEFLLPSGGGEEVWIKIAQTDNDEGLHVDNEGKADLHFHLKYDLSQNNDLKVQFDLEKITSFHLSSIHVKSDADVGVSYVYGYEVEFPDDDNAYATLLPAQTKGMTSFSDQYYYIGEGDTFSLNHENGYFPRSAEFFKGETRTVYTGSLPTNSTILKFEPAYLNATIPLTVTAGNGNSIAEYDGNGNPANIIGETYSENIEFSLSEDREYYIGNTTIPITLAGNDRASFTGWSLPENANGIVLCDYQGEAITGPAQDDELIFFKINKATVQSNNNYSITLNPAFGTHTWTDGDPATLVVDFYEEWNTKDVYPESLTLTGQKNENGVYEFTAAGNMLNKAPNKQGKLANSFMITDQTSVTIKGRNRDFNIANKDVVFLASDASIFENGVAHVTIRAYFDEWSSGVKTKFYYFPADVGTEETVTWAERDENGNISKYYYEIDIYSLQGFYGDFTGEYLLTDNDSITVYEVSDTGAATQVTSVRGDNHYRIDTGNNIIDEIRFTPVFTAPSSGTFNAYVNFDALERGTIAGEDRIYSTFNYDQSSDRYEATIQGDDIPTVTANQGESFNGYFLEVSDALENNKIRLVNTNGETITKVTPGSDFKILLDKDYVISTSRGDLPLTFKAQYDEHFTLNVNFAVSNNMQPFPNGSKYLDSYELPISTVTSDYYEVTIAGSRIDEDLALKDTSGKTHLLKGFTPDSTVLYENADTISLGQDKTLKIKHSAFQDGSATLTLTAVFSDDIDYTVKNAHNIAGNTFIFQSFTTVNGVEYGLYTGEISSHATWVADDDNLPNGLISFADYWNCSEPDVFFASGNAEVTRLLINTEYSLYIERTKIESDSDNNRFIHITPGKKLEMSITFDAGANGTITGEGSSTTKTVEAGTETYNASNGTWTGDITLPTVTPKDGYIFKQWTQQELSDLLDRNFTGTSASFSIGDSAARSRTEGFTYIAEYFHCDIKVVYGYGAHSAITGSNPVPVQVSSSGYSDGAYTFRLTFPDANSYTAAEGYTLNHFTMSQNGYSVSRASNGMAISTSDRFSPGETVDIMLNPGTDTDVTISFTAQYEERTALKVSFVDNTHAVGPFYPSPLQADSDGYYTFSLTIPSLLGNNDGFGYVFMRNKINNQNYSVLFYRGSEEAGYRDAFDNETVTVKAKVNDSASGNMIDLGIWVGTKGIKQSGEYMVPTSTNVSDENKVYLTKGTWEVSHNGTSDGYTYSVSEPALISSSYSDSLTFTKK